jgi:hypothetical protein
MDIVGYSKLVNRRTKRSDPERAFGRLMGVFSDRCHRWSELLVRTSDNVQRDSFMSFTMEKRKERATGIEPAWPAWKAGTLPLSYARAIFPKVTGE